MPLISQDFIKNENKKSWRLFSSTPSKEVVEQKREKRTPPGDSCGLYYFLPGPVPRSIGKQRERMTESQTESDCVSLSVERYLNELTQQVTPSFALNRCLLLLPYPLTQPTITLPQRLSLNVYIVIVPVPEIVQVVFHTQRMCNTPIWSKNSLHLLRWMNCAQRDVSDFSWAKAQVDKHSTENTESETSHMFEIRQRWYEDRSCHLLKFEM